MVTISQALLYYKRPEIQRAMVRHAENKEVCGSFNLEGFSKRPDILNYPAEILEMAKQGITSFHCSEEIWKDPLQLATSLPKNKLDELRQGWDLIIDIDCKELEFSKIAAHYLIQALRYTGIKSIYCKFSGNHGFHIGMPFEALPARVLDKDVKDLFPEAPRKIAEYLKFLIEPHIRKGLLEKYTKEQISVLINKPVEEIVKHDVLQPFSFLEVDTILISSRHMYRMPYSFNEKSGLVSIPIRPEDVLKFQKDWAIAENVIVTDIPFIERDIEPNQANKLFVQAYDFKPVLNTADEKVKSEKKFEDFQNALPEQFFPPCIARVLQGLLDGKKRAIFILVNFLSSVGWNKEQIEQRLIEWNKCNPEPLKEVYIKGQLASFRYKKAKVLPPNCDNTMYYHDLHICEKDNLCLRIKNPVNYARRKSLVLRQQKEAIIRPRLTEEQKAMRRAHREKLKQMKESIK